MTSVYWERVAAGRYASELHGHIIQAIRKDGPHEPGDRPYIAVVDRKPIDIGAWSLNQAKTQAIQFVERQAGKVKAERLNTRAAVTPAEPPMIPDPVDVMLAPAPEPEPILNGNGEQIGEYVPYTEPEPAELELVQVDPELVRAEPEPVQVDPEPVQVDPEPVPLQAVPGQLAITGRLGEGDLLDTLNALRSALELLREHAEIECTVNMPPVLKL